ncbi:MAG: hypothetical protein COA57_05460 [Flavobacteriales bacterium]|nr:MAG: hypothetical protein COA57_05460 [Flavobacteriales bacterium]
MNVKNCLLGLFLYTIFMLNYSLAQNLNPSIGIGALPNDADSVCNIPLYLGDYDSSGLQAGDTAADFTLYDLNGDSLNLATELQKGKPILLVAGSYTCPVFRGKESVINDIVTNYSNDISTFIIYIIEAHPDQDTSPYFGFVNTTSTNINEGILYLQPKTYGERKTVVTDMLSAMNFQAPVYLDGPCNNWWEYYGPAPNNSYLINTDGTIFSKHGWFDKYPNDIYCDIDSLLAVSSGNCSNGTTNGTFSFNLLSSNIATGAPNTTVYAYGELVNNNSKDVLIEIQRLQENIPSDWSTSMCTDVCLGTYIDSTTVLLGGGQTQSFTMYFYTQATPDSGGVKIGFRNATDQSNAFTQWFYGVTDSALVSTYDIYSKNITHSIYPNPFSEKATIELYDFQINIGANYELRIYDLFGRKVRESKIINRKSEIKRGSLHSGIYLYELKNEEGKISTGKLLIR